MDSLDPAVPLDQSAPEKPLVYEETPIIEPSPQVSQESPTLAQTSKPSSLPIGPNPKHGFSLVGMVKNVIFFVVLFAVGIGLSMFLKQYLPGGIPDISSLGLKNRSVPTPTLLATPSVSLNPFANWTSYQVTSGLSKQPVAGITYMLPPDILAPICDGGNCASTGTYLPGGTRFTVDARGAGQLLPDFRGKILSDLGGREFTVKDTTVAGRSAKEFTGVFTGTTIGGYAFSRMRGVMVEASDTVSVEFNHFTPTLVNADFTADDMLFDKILQSIQITLPLATPSVMPTKFIGNSCAGPQGVVCASGQACRLYTPGRSELGGTCVSESEVQP